MRVYLTTTVATADAIFRDGWTNLHEDCGKVGVHLADAQLGPNDGFCGPLTLCLDVPEDMFRRYEVEEAGLGYRYAIVPAEALNGLGVKPQVYDHEYAGESRRDFLQAIRAWDRAGKRQGDLEIRKHVQQMRDAFDFFDRIGWLTPVKLSEQAQQK
jgi:hypothetical protein